MKLLTINTHSLQGQNWRQDVSRFVEGILREMPDLVAMQEVNQTCNAPRIEGSMLEGQYPVPGYVTIRRDNFAAHAAALLRQAGVRCSWVWLPVKRVYGKYDEGIAFLSLNRAIDGMDSFPISKCNDYTNWRTRKVLGVRLEGLDDWFYSVQMGWWHDTCEPFLHQWKVLNCCVASKRICAPVWLMGDFSAPTCYRGESYDTILSSGWMDTYREAAVRDSGVTLPGRSTDGDGMRLDYIWCSEPRKVLSSQVVFNGQRGDVIAEHFGLLVEALPEASVLENQYRRRA